MNHSLTAAMALILGVVGSGAGRAQNAMPSMPTTRILAIGTINPDTDQGKVLAILPNEVREMVNTSGPDPAYIVRLCQDDLEFRNCQSL